MCSVAVRSSRPGVSKRGRPTLRRSSEKGSATPHRLKFASLVYGARVRGRCGDSKRTPQAEGGPLRRSCGSSSFEEREFLLCSSCVFCGALRDVCGHGRLKKKRARGKKYSLLLHTIIFCEPSSSKMEVHGLTRSSCAQLPCGLPDQGCQSVDAPRAGVPVRKGAPPRIV